MEDKVFLDEAGLGEVGKVIKEHYVNKEDIKDKLISQEDKKKLDSIDVEKIVKIDDIINDLTSGGTDKALSAEQGKILFQYANEGKEKIANALIGKGVENVSKDSSFSDLAKGVDEVKTGYGVGDVIEVDNLAETTIEVPVKTIRSNMMTANRVYCNSDAFYIYNNEAYIVSLGSDFQQWIVRKINLANGSAKIVVTDTAPRDSYWSYLFCLHDNIFLLSNSGLLKIYTLDGTIVKTLDAFDAIPLVVQVDSQQNVYFGCKDGNIYKMLPNYEITQIANITSYRGGGLFYKDFTIVNNDTLHIVGRNNADSSDKWHWEHFLLNLTTNEVTKLGSYLRNQGNPNYDYPTTGSDCCLYFNVSRGDKYPRQETLAKYDKNLNLIWEKQVKNQYGSLYRVFDGCLYFVKNNKLSVCDESLNLLWSFETKNQIRLINKIDDCLCLTSENNSGATFEIIKPPRKTKAYKILK